MAAPAPVSRGDTEVNNIPAGEGPGSGGTCRGRGRPSWRRLEASSGRGSCRRRRTRLIESGRLPAAGHGRGEERLSEAHPEARRRPSLLACGCAQGYEDKVSFVWLCVPTR
jgi:hypothetical protein